MTRRPEARRGRRPSDPTGPPEAARSAPLVVWGVLAGLAAALALPAPPAAAQQPTARELREAERLASLAPVVGRRAQAIAAGEAIA